VVKLLITESQADVNAKDSAGKTSLHYAIQNGHVNVAGMLAQFGAHANSKDLIGKTPLEYASTSEHAEAANILLDVSANVKDLKIVPVTKFTIAWSNDIRYWRSNQPCPESTFARVAYLHRVWYLKLSTVIPAVGPGTYEIVWRLKLHHYYYKGVPMNFFVEPVAEPGKTDGPKPLRFDPSSMWRSPHRSLEWFEIVMPERFVIEDKHGSVNVEIGLGSDDTNWPKGGISFDYIKLRDVGNSKRQTDPLSPSTIQIDRSTTSSAALPDQQDRLGELVGATNGPPATVLGSNPPDNNVAHDAQLD